MTWTPGGPPRVEHVVLSISDTFLNCFYSPTNSDNYICRFHYLNEREYDQWKLAFTSRKELNSLKISKDKLPYCVVMFKFLQIGRFCRITGGETEISLIFWGSHFCSQKICPSSTTTTKTLAKNSRDSWAYPQNISSLKVFTVRYLTYANVMTFWRMEWS